MDFRDALEIYLLGLGDEATIDAAMNEICASFPSDLDKPWEENAANVDKRVLSRRGTFQPEFVDDNGVKRLRLKTLMEVTGLPPHDLVYLSTKDLHPIFVDALDFIGLNRTNFIENRVEDKKPFYEAHAAIIDYGPPEVVENFNKKFKDTIGEVPCDYIDENGERYFTSESLAKHFGVTVEEVDEEFEKARRLGDAKIVSIPDGHGGETVH